MGGRKVKELLQSCFRSSRSGLELDQWAWKGIKKEELRTWALI